MASTSPILRRALLYIPGSNTRMIQKSLCFDVDSIAFDLEDSVTPAEKIAARRNVRQILSQPRAPGVRENAVRINSISSGLALDDLKEILPCPNLDAIVLPKCNSPADLQFLTDVIKHHLPERQPSSSPSSSPSLDPDAPIKPLRILALIESALGLISLPAICAATPLLSGLIFGADNFALDLSLKRSPDLTEFLYARSAIATAARAFNLPSTIDLVCTADTRTSSKQVPASPASSATPGAFDIFKQECFNGKHLGFTGKQIIRPSQILTVQAAFAPSAGEMAWATRVIQGSEATEKEGEGAFMMAGTMVDAPVVGKMVDASVVGKARAVMEKGQACRGEWAGLVRRVLVEVRPEGEAEGARVRPREKGKGPRLRPRGKGEGARVRPRGEGEGARVRPRRKGDAPVVGKAQARRGKRAGLVRQVRVEVRPEGEAEGARVTPRGKGEGARVRPRGKGKRQRGSTDGELRKIYVSK